MSQRPSDDEYDEYYDRYIVQAKGQNIVDALDSNEEQMTAIWPLISEEKGSYAYAEGKWSIKELLIHLIDTERIFATRAMRIARNDLVAQPGFDQDLYVPHSDADKRSVSSIKEEFELTRKANRCLFKNLNNESMQIIGTASGYPLSARAAGFIIAGHANHHIKVLKERYF